jgi:hypothetical protein
MLVFSGWRVLTFGCDLDYSSCVFVVLVSKVDPVLLREDGFLVFASVVELGKREND